MEQSKLFSLEKVIYLISLLLLTVVMYNYSPSPNDGITDDKKYYQQANTLKKHGIFKGFTVLKNQYLERQDPNIDDSSPRGHHPLRIGRILLHRSFLAIDSGLFSGTYVSLLFYILLGILCYWFLSLYWSERRALAVSLLVSLAPMLMGFSARALMETQHYFLMMLALFSAINYAHYPNKKNIAVLVLALFLNLAWKETSALFFPFFIGILIVSKWVYNKEIDYKHIAAAIFIPPIVLLLCHSIIFGLGDLYEIVTYQSNRHLFNERADYHVKSKNGPWYQYFVDFFILSPVVSILFFLGVGFFIARLNGKKIFADKNHQDINSLIFIAFLAYSFGVFSLLIKHVRYGIFLDFVYRFFAVSFIFGIAKQLFDGRKYFWPFIIGAMLIVIGSDLKQYHHFFVDLRLKNVWSRTILEAESFFKTMPKKKKKNNQNSAPKEDTDKETQQDQIGVLNKNALSSYNQKDYVKSIELATESVQLDRNSAFPYFILCNSYYKIQENAIAKVNCQKYASFDFSTLPESNRRAAEKRLRKVEKVLEALE